MISFFLCGILLLWCIINRIGVGGKIEGYPLGMPRGTVRALITLLIVSFPFTYILTGQEIPGLIVNAIFIVVAFYFETRRGSKQKLDIIEEIKYPEDTQSKYEINKHPLYLPKFSVRIMLIIILNFFYTQVTFEVTNTLFDLLIIVVLFIVGAFFRTIKNKKESKRLKNQITSIENYKSLNPYDILKTIEKEIKSWWEIQGKNVLSIVTFLAVLVSLLIGVDLALSIYNLTVFSLRETLLLLISVYYGFRD